MRRVSSLLLFALLALIGLGGCSTTVYESIPVGTTTDCDPAWPGRWLPVASPGDDAKPKDALQISADCRTATTKGEPKPMHLTLIGTKAGQYLQIHNDSGEPDCIGTGKTHCGYVLLRYEREGDIVRLFDPDHAKVALAIGNGGIKGFSERGDSKGLKTSEPIHRNFIAGDADRIGKVLRRHPELFAAEPLMVLRRVADLPASAEVPAPAEAVQPTPEQ